MWHDMVLFSVCISVLSAAYVVIAGNKKPAHRISGEQATRISQTNITK
jgi:hypothetical protein